MFCCGNTLLLGTDFYFGSLLLCNKPAQNLAAEITIHHDDSLGWRGSSSVWHGVGWNTGMAGRSKMPRSQGWCSGWLLGLDLSFSYWPGALPLLHMAVEASSQQGGWVLTKKIISTQKQKLQIPLRPHLTPYHFCHRGRVRKKHRASPDLKGWETDSISWWEKKSQSICSHL